MLQFRNFYHRDGLKSRQERPLTYEHLILLHYMTLNTVMSCSLPYTGTVVPLHYY
jgi:hypothetical protein